MKLEKELNLKIRSLDLNHEALLSIAKTASMVQKLAERFFSKYGVTDTQFNILMTLKQHGSEGISQQELSHRLIVTKSNVTGLVDRLEKIGYVERKAKEGDRRYNRIVLTPKGKRLVEKVEEPYFKEVDRLMNNLSETEKQAVIGSTGKLRDSIADILGGGL